MYRLIRIARIIISLIAMAVPTWALIAGYESVFVRMQILTALLSGVSVTLLFWALVTIIYGRLYCSTVCPLGTLMDCVSSTSRLVRRKSQAYRYRPPSRKTRLVFLLLTLLFLLSGTTIIPTLLDPYSAYARMVKEFLAIPFGKAEAPVRFALATFAVAGVTAVTVVAVSWKHGRLLCNTVCPICTVLGYGSRRPYFHFEIDPDRCINCGECERVCKSGCIKLPEKTIDHSRCVVCFDCVTVCPNAAITYKNGRYRLDMPMMRRVQTSGPSLRTTAPQQNSVTCSKK